MAHNELDCLHCAQRRIARLSLQATSGMAAAHHGSPSGPSAFGLLLLCVKLLCKLLQALLCAVRDIGLIVQVAKLVEGVAATPFLARLPGPARVTIIKMVVTEMSRKVVSSFLAHICSWNDRIYSLLGFADILGSCVWVVCSCKGLHTINAGACHGKLLLAVLPGGAC